MSQLDESNIKMERKLLKKPYKEIEQLISGPYKTFLGEVLLLDKNKSFTDDKGQRKIDLGKINYSTHRIGKPKDFEADWLRKLGKRRLSRVRVEWDLSEADFP